MEPVEFMVFSDFLCPWCYVGALRLADIAAEEGDGIEWVWRSYLLRPEPEVRDLEEFTDYTRRWERPASLEPRARFVTWTGEHPPPTHSFPSALAAKVAGRFGPDAYRAFADALFRAYFTENRTISERAVLVEVAAAAGLDHQAFEQRWNADENDLLKEVWQDYGTAVQSGISGVPAVVVDRRWLVAGAVEVDEYRAAIAQARQARREAAAQGRAATVSTSPEAVPE